MMLSFLYVAFVRVVQLVRLSYCAQDDLAIEIVMLRHEVAVLQPVRLLLAGRLLRRGTPLGDRRRRGLGCCTRPVHRTNGHPGRTLTGGASHEPWAILCRHPPVPEVGEDAANPCLVAGLRNVIRGVNLQLSEPIGQFCLGSLARSTAHARSRHDCS
jgi:hypothetical protein